MHIIATCVVICFALLCSCIYSTNSTLLSFQLFHFGFAIFMDDFIESVYDWNESLELSCQQSSWFVFDVARQKEKESKVCVNFGHVFCWNWNYGEMILFNPLFSPISDFRLISFKYINESQEIQKTETNRKKFNKLRHDYFRLNCA